MESTKQLAQSRPSGTSAVLLFQGDTGKKYENIRIVVANTGTKTTKYSIFHDKDGTTYSNDTALVYNVSLQKEATDLLDLVLPVNNSGGAIGVQVDLADNINFTLYGDELA